MPQHCDPDILALMALGESVDTTCEEHVGACGQCQQEVAALRDVVAAGRAGGGPAMLVEPPSRVWDSIAEQLTSEPVPLRPAAPAQGAGGARGLPRWLGLVAATAAGILIGGGAVAIVTGQDSSGSVVASAQLTPLPDGPDRGGQAAATLNRAGSGYTVTVKAPDMSGPDGFYEVWLMSPDDSGLIALGSLGPGEKQATFPVPDGVDLQTFNAVDVSDEPLDGDPGHSSVSVLRGTLDT